MIYLGRINVAPGLCQPLHPEADTDLSGNS